MIIITLIYTEQRRSKSFSVVTMNYYVGCYRKLIKLHTSYVRLTLLLVVPYYTGSCCPAPVAHSCYRQPVRTMINFSNLVLALFPHYVSLTGECLQTSPPPPRTHSRSWSRTYIVAERYSTTHHQQTALKDEAYSVKRQQQGATCAMAVNPNIASLPVFGQLTTEISVRKERC